ncbi:hypothetical protein H5P28_14220 [Ruficoccus amylovorans]|uniref:Uncharacterized protein n=1 Tax=Ruficoccus amylovorans TaxID=1804625 RepID=A0A842HGJ5_9BACT|nr:hypothetical protein [Ruficoccus amylovorans]MBC2595419.1 hypothetical protein [Ruficoccus amylovorans]
MARIVGHDGKVLRFVPLHQEREYAVPFEQLSDTTQKQILEYCPTSFLQLDENWDRKNSHAGLDNTTIKDLVILLGQWLTRNAPQPSRFNSVFNSAFLVEFSWFDRSWLYGPLLDSPIKLFDDIYYLESLQEVRHRLHEALEMGRSQAVITDGFPMNSFRLWMFPVRREYRYARGYENLNRISGYNTLGIMVDRQDQIVAVECLRTSDVPMLDRSDLWEANTIHFLGLKKKFAADATVLVHTPTGSLKKEFGSFSGEAAHLGSFSGDAVHMTEVMFFSSDQNPIRYSISNKKPLSYSRMYMPDGLARLIAYNIYINWR